MKRLCFIAIVVGLTLVGLGWWYHRHQLLTDRRTDAAQAAAVESALQERIDTADFAGKERNWGTVLDKLKSHCNVPLTVNEAEAAAMGVDRQTRVDVPEGVLPLEELLDAVTGAMDLAWRRDGGRIEITAVSIAEPWRDRLITRVYPLPAVTAAGGKLVDSAEDLYDLITTCIEPDSWDDVGGNGLIVPAGGTLVIRQTAAIHRQIAALLARMAELPDAPPRQFRVEEIAEADAAVERTLAKEMSVDFQAEAAGSALTKLAEQAGVAIRWENLPPLDGSEAWQKVSYRGSREPLRSILTVLTAQIGHEFRIANGGILLTIPDESPGETWFYDVGDLVAADGGDDFDTLIDLLTTTVEPDLWDEVGGPGTIKELGDRWLVVSQTQAAHERLRRILSRLRAHLAPGVDPAGDLPLEPIDDVAPAIHKALDTEARLTYEHRPLEEALAELSQRLAIPVVPRRLQLDGVAVPLDTTVTCDLPPLPLRHALANLLDEHKLTLDPRGEVLYVTTPEDAESELVTRIIDVRHLVEPDGGGFDQDTIANLVTSCVEPEMWEEVGGPGSTCIFRGLLVFRQTYDVSRQVQELIDALSQHCLPTGAPTPDARRPVWVGLSEREQQIIEQLKLPVSFSAEMPRIADALADLSRQASIPLHYDRLWYEEAWLAQASFTFDLSFDRVPLWRALKEIEERKAVGFVLRHGMLVVTDPQHAAEHTMMRLYPLRLPKRDDVPERADQVADMLVERLEPDAWRTNGGYGAIKPVGDEWLLVVQTLPMHRRVEEALRKLERGELPRPPMP